MYVHFRFVAYLPSPFFFFKILSQPAESECVYRALVALGNLVCIENSNYYMYN